MANLWINLAVAACCVAVTLAASDYSTASSGGHGSGDSTPSAGGGGGGSDGSSTPTSGGGASGCCPFGGLYCGCTLDKKRIGKCNIPLIANALYMCTQGGSPVLNSQCDDQCLQTDVNSDDICLASGGSTMVPPPSSSTTMQSGY